MGQEHSDTYGTAELRRRVMAAWADSPARFRADANTEEDFALTGYRDRIIVELAQNAADAARRAGSRGRLLLALRGMELTAANTGAPLTAAGVESLSTLRASAKRDEDAGPGAAEPEVATVGRFGVGFSAIAAFSDDVTIASHDGAVRWHREKAAKTVQEELTSGGRSPGLATEIERRDGRVPLLRLPFATEARPPAGYDTAVTAVLRDERSRAAVTQLLTDVPQALLLALPDLAEVLVDVEGAVRTLRGEPLPTGLGDVLTSVASGDSVRQTRWRVLRRSGRFTADDLRDRPAEEQERPDWTLTWALPVDDTGAAVEPPPGIARVVHAPTPSDTPMTVPALLIGTFPLSPDRRHVAPGPATTTLLSEAAKGYCELLSHVEARTTLDLVPPRLAAKGEIDGHFHEELYRMLPDSPFLTTASGEPVRPRDAVVLEGGSELVDLLADLIPTALPATWNQQHPALARLGVRHVRLAELTDLLTGLDAEPAWWARLYAALRVAASQGVDLADLGALPVPLVDGRLVRGPRGLLLMSPDASLPETLSPENLTPLGLRVVHPDAADPLLERLGAVRANERAVLTDPRTRAAVENSLDLDDPERVTEPILELVSASGVTVEEAPWLAELALRDTEDVYSPAGEMLLGDSPLREVLIPDAPFGVVAEDLVERYGAETLQAIGVLHGFMPLRAHDVTLDPEGDESLDELALDSVEEWAAAVSARLGHPELPPTVPEFLGIRDLEFVGEDGWPVALRLLAGHGQRMAVVAPTRVVTSDGRAVDVPSYTAWWISQKARLAGRRPSELRLRAGADPALEGLYDPCPPGIDQEFATAIGVRETVRGILDEPRGPDQLLARLADPKRPVPRARLRRILAEFATLAGDADTDRVTPPDRVRAVMAGGGENGAPGSVPEAVDRTVVADADDVMVVDAPDLLPLLAGRPVVLVPPHLAEPLADVLDLPLASEELPGEITSIGDEREVPAPVRPFLDGGTDRYVHHTRLTVDGTVVPWRYVGGRVHASGPDGLARGLAWAAGAWPHRHLLAALLYDPASAPRLLAEHDLDPEI